MRTIRVRCIPLRLRSKTRRRATPLLPSWIYSYRSRVTVSYALPFTTNVTISTSISQTFRSWVAIFLLRQPMVFLSHSSYGMPGLFSSYECFILRAARLSSKLLGQGYVIERLKSSLRKFYGRYGISSNIMNVPKCYMTFWDMTIYNDTLNWSDITPICELISELDFITDFGGFHRTLQRVRLANRGRLLLRTPGPVPFGTRFVLMLRPFFPKLVMSTYLLSFEHPSVLLFFFYNLLYFSDFMYTTNTNKNIHSHTHTDIPY